ncbi:hypothetical protein AHAS_Ahas17G0180500 [Arachis hypogaea]
MCGGEHPSERCDSYTGGHSVYEQVNFMGHSSREKNDPFSKTYNLGWRNHPNFGWSNQGQRNFNNSYQPTNHQKSPLEFMVEKLSQATEVFMQESRAISKNQEPSIRNLEVQVGQKAKQLAERGTTFLPSDTIVNPRKEYKAISLKSETVINKVLHKKNKKIIEDPPKEQREENS